MPSNVADDVLNWPPRCLLPLAPRRIELSEAHDESRQPLAPTLAGYRLRPGREYELWVESPDGVADHDWTLRMISPPFITLSGVEAAREGGRLTVFRVGGYRGWSDLWRRPVLELPFRAQFPDGRPALPMSVPVMLAGSWWDITVVTIGLLFSLLPALNIALSWWRGSSFVAWLSHPIAITVAVVFAAGLILWFGVWRLVRAQRAAHKFVTRWNDDLASAEKALLP